MARVNEGHIEVRVAGDAEGSFLELWCFARPPCVSEAIAIHEQTKRKNANSVFMEERPDFKVEFNNSDAAALANNDFAIPCLYIGIGTSISSSVNLSFFVSVLGSTK